MLHKRFITVLLWVVSMGILSCGGKKEETGKTAETPVSVALSKVSPGSARSVLASGQVESAQTAAISTRMMGRITNIYVNTGDQVRKGQVLVTISDEDMKAKRAQTSAMIAEAEAAFAAAQKDYDRFTNLYKEQSATAKELDNVTLQYRSAQERLNAARQMRNEVSAMMAYSSLTAPFSGVVTQKLAEVGNIANPGMPVLMIEQNGILQVSANVAESDISRIAPGDVARVQVKSTNKNFEGKIIRLNPSAQFTGGQYEVKISVPEADKKDVLAGMFVNVEIPLKDTAEITTDDKVLIPRAAIVSREELTGIYTVGSGNRAILRWLRLGKVYGDKVEVLSGLSKDESFISHADGKLYNGVPVTIRSAQ